MLGLVLIALLTIGAHTEGSEEGCKIEPANIVFVLDESGSIYGPHFTQQLEFVENFIDSVNVGLDKTRIGVLAFADRERIIFHLDQYTEKTQMKTAVKGIKQARGQTYTNLALKTMREEMFTVPHSRPGIRHVAIVITDGDPDDKTATAKQGDILRSETDIEVHAVGVGNDVSRYELERIAKTKDFVYTVDDYSALQTLLKRLTTVCPATTAAPKPEPITDLPTQAPTAAPIEPTTPEQQTQGCVSKVDQIWSISELAGVRETNYALDLIKRVTRSITAFGRYTNQTGLAPRFCVDGKEIHLKDHDTLQGFWSDLEGHRMTGTQTHRVINYIRTTGMSAVNGGRSTALKYGILIVDFAFANWEETLKEAEAAKSAGIKLIVIGVGEDVQQEKLQQLASLSDGYYFYVSSYSKLIDLADELIDLMCKDKKTHCAMLRRKFLERFERLFDY